MAGNANVYQNIVNRGHSTVHLGNVYGSHKTRRDLLLESLAFDGLHCPRELEAFPGTYQWIFEEKRTSFPEWARSGSSLFWITGKAGSGKSTLMKFLVEHECTQSLLHEWAGDKELIIADFFFWNAGNKMQKSRQGLMQSLLYRIIEESTPLDLERVAPHRRTADTSAWMRPWTRRELSDTLDSLVGRLSAKQRFCFFVDGLDEYEAPGEGSHYDLVDDLNALVSSPFVKACIASRPWHAFADAYGKLGRHQISMQELTQSDMSAFIEGRLIEDPHFAALLERDERAISLVDSIRDRAQGVFFWVVLAVEDIRRGLRGQDDLGMLHRRIQLLPKEVDEILERNFQAIEPVYAVYAARILLLLTLSTTENAMVELLEYSYVKELAEDPDSAFNARLRSMAADELKSRLEKTRRDLNLWCRDFLDVQCHLESEYPGSFWDRLSVTFSHRTVADFVHEKYNSGVLQRMAGRRFSPSLERAKIMLHTIKALPSPHHPLEYARVFLIRMQDCEKDGVNYIPVFEALFEVLSHSPPSESDIELEIKVWGGVIPRSDASSAVNYNLHSAARHALQRRDITYTAEELHFVLAASLMTSNGPSVPKQIARFEKWGELRIKPDIVKLVLERLINPDTDSPVHPRGGTIWQEFLQACMITYCPMLRAGWDPGISQMVWAIDLLLGLGADPDARIARVIHRSGNAIYQPFMTDRKYSTWKWTDQTTDSAIQLFAEMEEWLAGDEYAATPYRLLRLKLQEASRARRKGRSKDFGAAEPATRGWTRRTRSRDSRRQRQKE